MTEGLQNNQFIPSIVIALDEPSEEIVKTIRNIFFRRNNQQSKVCDIFAFSLRKEQFELNPIGEESHNSNQDPDQNRPVVFTNFIGQVSEIHKTLIEKMNEIEDHNRLIDAGYIMDRDIPVNLFLIADGKDPHGGGVILPMIFLINDMIIKHRNAKLHVLLDVGHFNESDADADIQVFSLLQEFLEVFVKDSDSQNRLCENLKIRPSDLSNVTLYLFHNKKENTGGINDHQTMKIMIGNALLTLLLNDMARRFSLTTRESNVKGEAIVFNSIGSVVTAYDPQSLQDYLAKKCTVETIDDVLLVPGLKGTAATEANRLIQVLGEIDAWTRELFSSFPGFITQIIYQPETNRYSIKFKKYSLEKIEFLEFKELDFCLEVEQLEQEITTRILQECQLTIQENAAVLVEKITGDIHQFSEDLLLLAQSYPGGIDTTCMSLNNLKEILLDEIPEIHKKNRQIEKSIRKPRKKLQRIKKAFSKIGKRTPGLPKIIDKLPEKYQELFAGIYYHIIFLIPILIVRWLRSKVPKYLQEIAGVKIHLLANQENLAIINQLCDDENGVITSCLADLEKLSNEIDSIKKSLLKQPGFPLGQEENAWTPFFRVPVLKESIAEHLYKTGKWAKSDIIDDLIVNKKLFSGWKKDVASLHERMVDFHLNLFKHVWDFDLAEIHQLFLEYDDSGAAMHTSEKIQKYLSISLPLLRPAIETGETEYAQIGRYYLMGDTNWSDFNIPARIVEMHHWQTIWTFDPYSLIVAQAWHNLNYAAIAPLFRSAEKKYERLTSKEKSAFGIVTHRNFVSTIKETSDVIEREYQWQFTPKNSNKTHTFTIRLDIDLERYRKYAAEERLRDIKEWNHYSQKEMPEINKLALEFQKLFADHEWSTFNKAFCILKFVQNAITYQLDQDSKGTPQWSRYPIETLAEGVGDCEDVAILCCAVLLRLGFEVILLDYPKHVAFGVCGNPDMKGDYVYDKETGKKYYFGEATSDGWQLGQIPDRYKGKTPLNIIKVERLVSDDEPEV